MPTPVRPSDERTRRVPSPKARGELAEARFLARAMELGLTVSKPFGFGAWPAQLHGQRARPYRRDEIEFLVACIVPEDAWFIIPIRAIYTSNHLFLPANSRPHRLSRYREAWHLLTRTSKFDPPLFPPYIQ